MVRTQIQLTEEQADSLRRHAEASGRSLSDLVRQSVDLYLQSQKAGGRQQMIERARRAAGSFSSGSATVSADHDQHLAEAYRS